MSDTGAPNPTPQGKPRWRWLLYGSLALNFLLLGLGGGMLLRAPFDHHRPPPPEFGAYLRSFEPGQRLSLARKARDEWRRAPPEAREAGYAQVLAALRAEPFDPGALAAALTNQRARAAGRLEKAQALFVQQVAQLSPAERAAYAARLEAQLERRRDRD